MDAGKVIGYLCACCVAEARGERWQPEEGDVVHLCNEHYEFFFTEVSTVPEA